MALLADLRNFKHRAAHKAQFRRKAFKSMPLTSRFSPKAPSATCAPGAKGLHLLKDRRLTCGATRLRGRRL
jgi:hypothetical protein